MLKKCIFILLLFFLFNCAEDFKVMVRFYNMSKYNAINVYIGSNYYNYIPANDKTSYKYITPKEYRVIGQFYDVDNTSDFSKKVKIDYFNTYSITLDNNGDIDLIIEDKK